MGKKIAFLYTPTKAGEEKMHIFALAEQLRAAGNEVEIFESLSSCGAKRRLIKAFRRNRPSIVHLHGERACTIGIAICNRLQLPVAITAYDGHTGAKLLYGLALPGQGHGIPP